MSKQQNKARKEAINELCRYVRIKECLETTGLPFVGICFTCDRRFHITALDAGHFVSGRRNAVVFEENGIHIQCSAWCNRVNHGNPKIYKDKMLARYGKEEVKRLEQLKHKVIQDKDMDFEGIAKKYKAKYESVMRKYGYKTWSEILKGD